MAVKDYVVTIGIECHVQLKTNTKLFAAVDNDARDKPPNTTVSPVCFGLPGVLPVLNEEALTLAIRSGHALNAKVAERSVFDRKHYFYPDLPKGYQISQFHEPIVGIGHIDVPVNGEYKRVGITRAHLEEDAGKLTHDNPGYSLVDLNRAGTPLLEIVSDPDMHSAEEAKAYAQELYYLMSYAEVSDVDLYHGNMRFDVNISLAPAGAKELGTRSEIKNINSFKAVERSVEFEINRQAELLDSGQKVVQETRGWDDAKQKTISQRSKEDAHDYRYFPDPDIPPVVLTAKEIEAQKEMLPELPKSRRQKFKTLSLDLSQVETLIANRKLGDLILEIMEKTDTKTAKRSANWITGDVMAQLNQTDNGQNMLDTVRVVELSNMVDDGKLNSNAATKILVTMMNSMDSPAVIAEAAGFIQVSDSNELQTIVDRILTDNPKAVEELQNGEQKVMDFLIGQVMQATKGQANPAVATKLINEMISK